MSRPDLDPAVAAYYSRTPEESRLEQGPFRLEAIRTRELIQRHAPPPPAAVLDVGGAAGAYALWLASLGYEVHLVDPVERLVREAATRSAAAAQPLASALDGLARGLFEDPRFSAIVAADRRDGQHRNTTERIDYFTTAYFHRPDELSRELADAGLSPAGVVGIEGPGWLLPDIAERMDDDRRRSDLEHVARLLESEPSLIGASAHLLAVGVA